MELHNDLSCGQVQPSVLKQHLRTSLFIPAVVSAHSGVELVSAVALAGQEASLH